MKAAEVADLYVKEGNSVNVVGAIIKWMREMEERLGVYMTAEDIAGSKADGLQPPNFNAAMQEAGDRERAAREAATGKPLETGSGEDSGS